MSKDDERESRGAWGIGLFLGLFLMVGLGALCLGFDELARNGTDREGVIALFVVGTMFTVVPGGLLMRFAGTLEKLKDMERRKVEFPDEPWRWRADWDEGRLANELPSRVYLQWIFGTVFCLVGAYLLFNWKDVMKNGPEGYLFLSVPILGGIFLLSAVFVSLRRWKWRETVCELQTNPGAIGGRFLATVKTPVHPAQFDSIETRLTCYYYDPDDGIDTGHGMRTELWRETRTVPGASVGMDAQGGALIPLDFAIPSTCEPSTPELKTKRVQWELSITAMARGIGLSAMYIVPVFRVTGEQTLPFVESSAPDMPMACAQTILTRECGDEIEFHYADRAARILVALMFSIATVVHFSVLVYYLNAAHMPRLMGIIFMAFGLPLLYATLWLWFGKCYVSLSPTSLTEVSSMLGFSRRKAIPLGEIVLVDAQVDGRSGKTLYYAIRVHTDAGVRLVLKGIRDKGEADGLVRQIEDYLARHRPGSA